MLSRESVQLDTSSAGILRPIHLGGKDVATEIFTADDVRDRQLAETS